MAVNPDRTASGSPLGEVGDLGADPVDDHTRPFDPPAFILADAVQLGELAADRVPFPKVDLALPAQKAVASFDLVDRDIARHATGPLQALEEHLSVLFRGQGPVARDGRGCLDSNGLRPTAFGSVWRRLEAMATLRASA
jgi:hypothetical protein